MSTLIIKSKIWNNLSGQSINYKDKNFRQQKLSIDHSAIIYRSNDKIVSRQIDESNPTSNSNDNTNFMNEKRDELLSILKQGDNKFVVNCGNWSKNISKLIDENAAFILYKGLTIENLLKEKQKYYVLSQGDIIKLGKVYLKLLHINTSNSDKDDEDEEEKMEDNNDLNNNNSIKEEVKEEDKEEYDEIDKENEEDIKDNIEENDIEKEEEKILQTFSDGLKQRKYNKKIDSISLDNKNNNYSFSYFHKKCKNIDLYIKQHSKENKKDRLNKSFNGTISNLISNNIIKETININYPKSPKFSKIKSLTLLNKFKSNNLTNICTMKNETKPKMKEKTLKKKISKPKKKKINLKNNIKPSPNNSEIIIPPIGKICRICLSGEDNPINNPLLCPCICKGSMKYIHYQCLKNWLNLKVEAELGHRRNLILEQPTITYSTNDISCELCKARLPDYIRHNGKIFNVLFYKPKYDKFLVFESIRDDNRRTKFIHIIPMIKKTMIKIGRLNTCDLCLPDISISRVHCCLYIEGGQLFLENNSKYGSKILIQNNNLVMSSNFPLCIEVQNTYLKLILKKNFSLFGCCGVNTTTISRMLVYQEQNEKCFDIFCSMIIREDNDNERENEEEKKEENQELNNEINNEINSQNIGNDESNNNIVNEERIRKEINERLNNEGETDNKINNINKEIIGEIGQDKKKINEIKIINEIKQQIKENEFENESGIINLNNSSKNNSKKEIFTKIEDEKNTIKSIKSIKIIKQDKKDNISNYINRTFENEGNNFIFNEAEIQSKSKIQNDINRTIQNLDYQKINDNILANLKKEQFKNNEIIEVIKKEVPNKKEKEEIKDIDLEENKILKNIQLAEDETQRTKIKKKENKIIPTPNNKNNLIINIEETNEAKKEILKHRGNKNKKEIESGKKGEESDEEVINKEIKKLEIDGKHKIEMQKKILNKRFKDIERNNNSINIKETKYDKTMSEQKEEPSQNTLKLEEKETKGIKQIKEENIKKNLRFNAEKKINNKEVKKIKKPPYKSIDLNAINELSYGQIPNSQNINYSPIDSYHSIFGLRVKNNNEGSSLLAPKHKNINFQKLDLNSNNEKNNIMNKSNASWNRYTYQYEEDKKNKNNN